MRKTFATVFAAGLLFAAALPLAAEAQNRRDRDYDSVRTASPSELASADRRLNQVYQRRVVDARADDRADRRVGMSRGWYSQEAALRDTERQWIAFRDAECRYLTQQFIGARDRGALARGCLLNQTNERIAELRDAEMMLSAR